MKTTAENTNLTDAHWGTSFVEDICRDCGDAITRCDSVLHLPNARVFKQLCESCGTTVLPREA